MLTKSRKAVIGLNTLKTYFETTKFLISLGDMETTSYLITDQKITKMFKLFSLCFVLLGVEAMFTNEKPHNI